MQCVKSSCLPAETLAHPNSYSFVNSKPTHPLLPWHLLSICHLFCFKCSNAPGGSQFISIGEDKFWWSFDYVSWKYMEQVFTTLVLWNNAPVESKKKKLEKQNKQQPARDFMTIFLWWIVSDELLTRFLCTIVACMGRTLYIFVHLEVKVNSLIVLVVLKNDETVLQEENQYRYITRTIKLK